MSAALALWAIGTFTQPLTVDQRDVMGCTPRPIVGSLGYNLALQAQDTNAQLYGAIAFAERRLFKADKFAWAFDMSVINNVIRVPTLAAGCHGDARYGMEGVDLYSSSSGMMFSVTDWMNVFYAGSITGSIMQHPSDDYWKNRTFTSYRYAFSGIFMNYAAPLAPLFNKQDGPTSTVGDFLLGTKFWIPEKPEIGELYVAYAYSNGLFTNINIEKLKLIGMAYLDDFEEIAIAKAGFKALGLGEHLGKLNLYARTKKLKGPLPSTKYDPEFGQRDRPQINEQTLPWERSGDTDFRTLHLEEMGMFGQFDLYLAYAWDPKPMLHQAMLIYRGWAHLSDEGGFSAAHLESGFTAGGGVIQLPDMPWYGVRGGLKPSFFIGFLDAVRLGYNDSPTLEIFPFAQDATQLSLSIHLAM